MLLWWYGLGSKVPEKAFFFETIGSIFNERHQCVVGQEVFADSFTEWQANKIFVVCDEVSSTDKRSVSDRIKGWITATKNNINVKKCP